MRWWFAIVSMGFALACEPVVEIHEEMLPVDSFVEAVDGFEGWRHDQLVLVDSGDEPAMRAVFRAPVTPMILSSKFGERRDPFLKTRRFHTGADFDAPLGAHVYAAAAGIVVHAGEHRAFGREVVVDHGDGIRSYYAHLRDIRVEPGELVEEGDPLGTVGNTGRSTAPHLHFAVQDAEGRFLDPVAILAQELALPPGDPRRALRVHVGDPMVLVAGTSDNASDDLRTQ